MKHSFFASLASTTLFAVPSFFGNVATAQVFECTVQSAQSSVNSAFTFNANLPGSLIGTYTPENLTGSRTKGGLFGSFGSTENVAVPINILAGVTNAQASSPVVGSFTLTLDTGALTASVSNFTSSVFTQTPAVFPVTANVTIPSFRTRAPSSTYIAATLPLPIGNATISLVRADQSGDALGLLTPVSEGVYDFAIALLVTYSVTGELAGSPISSPGTVPVPATLVGRVTIDGSSVTVTSSNTISQSDDQLPAAALPPLNFDLPTILPPGLVVPVILNLTLERITTSISGSQQLVATGETSAPPCFADYNLDGGIDGADVDAFFIDWSAGSSAADVNQDGGVDGSDVDLFFIQWSAGGC
jgi:hypothetical protein